MKRSTRWLTTLFATAAIVAGSLVPGLAAEPAEIRRLVLENHVAQVISDLNLTSQQKSELKEIVARYRDTVNEKRAELAELLTQRRDALLANDQERLAEVQEALQQLARHNPWESDEAAQAFLAGLTERQKQVLGRILPGIQGREEKRAETRMERYGRPGWHGPPHDGRMRRAPLEQRLVIARYGSVGDELLDVFSEMLERSLNP